MGAPDLGNNGDESMRTPARFQIPASIDSFAANNSRKTPVRGETVAGGATCSSSGGSSMVHTPSGGGSGKQQFLLRKAASSYLPKTPNSGPRMNPFDSQMSHD